MFGWLSHQFFLIILQLCSFVKSNLNVRLVVWLYYDPKRNRGCIGCIFYLKFHEEETRQQGVVTDGAVFFAGVALFVVELLAHSIDWTPPCDEIEC